MKKNDKFIIAKKKYSSRLIVGTGKYKSMEECAKVIKISGADDFKFTANTFTALSGSSIVVPDGGLTFGTY